MCTISKMKLSDKFGSSLIVLLLVCIDFQLLVDVKIKRRFSEIKRRFVRVKCRFIFVKRRFGLAKQKKRFFLSLIFAVLRKCLTFATFAER